MPASTRRRELVIGGIGAALVGGYLLLHRAPAAASPAAAADAIPADSLPVSGAGAGGDGIGLGTSSALALPVADATSSLAAVGAAAASTAAAGSLGTQASMTPGTGSQVPTGSGSSAAGPGLAAPLYNPIASIPGSPQYAALANPDALYIAAGPGQAGEALPGFSPDSARAWWAAWFANPYNLRLVDPAALPGSLVLTADQAARAIALENAQLPAPPAWEPANPNLYQRSTTLAVIQAQQAAGNPNYAPFPVGYVPPPAPTSAPAPAPAPSTSTQASTLQAAIAKISGYIATYQAIPASQRTAAQNAALATDLATRSSEQTQLAALH